MLILPLFCHQIVIFGALDEAVKSFIIRAIFYFLTDTVKHAVIRLNYTRFPCHKFSKMGKEKKVRQKKPHYQDFLRITKPRKSLVVAVIEENLENIPGWSCAYDVIEHIFSQHSRNSKSEKSRFDVGGIVELIALLTNAISREGIIFEIEEMANHFEVFIKMKSFIGWAGGEHTRWLRVIYEEVVEREIAVKVIKTAHPVRKMG